MNPDSEVTSDIITKEELKFRRDYQGITREYHLPTGERFIVLKEGFMELGKGTATATIGTFISPYGGLGIPAIALGTSTGIEGLNKIGSSLFAPDQDLGIAVNPIRDSIFKGNQNAYEAVENVTIIGSTIIAQNIYNNFPKNLKISKQNENYSKASKYLDEMNVSEKEKLQILSSFQKETIKLEYASENEYGIRFYDIDWEKNVSSAKPVGQYLTSTFTNLTNRNNLVLPYEWNKMTALKQWQIAPGTPMITGKVAPQLNYGVQYIGGAEQKFILKPWEYKTLLEVFK
ncbi:hypothetical protein [Fusobacterium russii]|uniref:hypothetical protein n=1 Tax=Fusobacterium russii TaxID=854 RepID=UPI0003AA9AEB|nr:hypothetical protein [Fusobacterium russii]